MLKPRLIAIAKLTALTIASNGPGLILVLYGFVIFGLSVTEKIDVNKIMLMFLAGMMYVAIPMRWMSRWIDAKISQVEEEVAG